MNRAGFFDRQHLTQGEKIETHAQETKTQEFFSKNSKMVKKQPMTQPSAGKKSKTLEAPRDLKCEFDPR